MDEKGFLRALKKVAKRRWFLRDETYIRVHGRKGFADRCPLEEVAGTGEYSPCTAADKLGIGNRLGKDIMNAADNVQCLSSRNRAGRLRKAMLRILNLGPKATGRKIAVR